MNHVRKAESELAPGERIRHARVERGKLTQIDVERVDAVDEPATGHRWIITKSEPVRYTSKRRAKPSASRQRQLEAELRRSKRTAGRLNGHESNGVTKLNEPPASVAKDARRRESYLDVFDAPTTNPWAGT